MFNLKFSDDGGGIVGHEQLLQVVDHHLVHAVRAVGCGDGVGKLLARIWEIYENLKRLLLNYKSFCLMIKEKGSSGMF